MFNFLALVAVLALASGSTLPRSKQRDFPWSLSGRIIGGDDANIEDAPYQISLRLNGRHICGGSILSRDWIITAGHCVDDGASSYSVYAGSREKFNGGSLHSVAGIIRHENYALTNMGIPFNDIALIRVNESFALDATRQPVHLFDVDEELTTGTEAVITGWGTIDSTGSITKILQIAAVPIISREICDESYRNIGGLPVGEICAGLSEGGKDSCQGDSGGPLVINGRLAGITSWGIGCADAGKPGVYTEIAFYREWINLNSGV